MRIPAFECFYPSSLSEAAVCLKAEGDRAQVMAGGTDLIVAMKQRTFTPAVVVNLKRIPGLSGISMDADGGITIGAMAKLRDIATSPIVKQHYPELARAASQVASPQIRNIGTIGGNICLQPKCYFIEQSLSWWDCQECRKRGGASCYIIPNSNRSCFALMAADTVPALIAYDAKVRLTGPDQERVIALEELYSGTGIGHLTLKPGEIVSDIQIPPSNGKVAFLKYAPRNTIDFAAVSVAISLGHAAVQPRIVLGAIASGPVRAKAAEELLAQNPDVDVADEVGKLASQKVKIVSWVRGPIEYKKHIIHIVVRDLVRRLQGRTSA